MSRTAAVRQKKTTAAPTFAGPKALSAFDQFLDAAGRQKLLTADEERALCKLKDIGRAAQRRLDVDAIIGGAPVASLPMSLLPPKEQALRPGERALLVAQTRLDEATRSTLLAEAVTGLEARDELVMRNLRFGVSKAKKYKDYGVDMEDLVGAANDGLVHAADLFDWRKGRFTTYAGWWVTARLLTTLGEQTRPLKVPAWRQSDVRKLSRTYQNLLEKLARAPDEHELAEASGITVKRVKDMMVFLGNSVSLDQPVGNGGDGSSGRTVGDVITGSQDMASTQITSRRVEERDAHQTMMDMLARLGPNDHRMIDLHYGLTSGNEMTFEQIGEQMGLCRETVRKRCKELLDKLKGDPSVPALRDCYDDLTG